MPAGDMASCFSPADPAGATEYGARFVVSHSDGFRLSLRFQGEVSQTRS
jgi:hypothetical protein